MTAEEQTTRKTMSIDSHLRAERPDDER